MPDPLPPVTAASAPPAAAIVLAAGRGTRMRSSTTKVLHPIGGRTLLGHAVHAVAALDPAHLVVVLGHDREQVTAAVDGLGSELGRTVHVAVQDRQLGTGHAVACGLTALADDVTGPVVVSSGDVPLLETRTVHVLLAEHRRTGAAVTVLTTEPEDRERPAGRVRRVDAHYVYGRAGLPCRRCGTPVQRAELAARSIFWCPVCQPAD